jgi:hypothetical protein
MLAFAKRTLRSHRIDGIEHMPLRFRAASA